MFIYHFDVSGCNKILNIAEYQQAYSGPSLLTSTCQQFTSAPYYLSHVRVHHWTTLIAVQNEFIFVLQMPKLGRGKKPLSKSSAQRQRLARQLRSRREAGAATAAGKLSVAAGNP